MQSSGRMATDGRCNCLCRRIYQVVQGPNEGKPPNARTSSMSRVAARSEGAGQLSLRDALVSTFEIDFNRPEAFRRTLDFRYESASVSALAIVKRPKTLLHNVRVEKERPYAPLDEHLPNPVRIVYARSANKVERSTMSLPKKPACELSSWGGAAWALCGKRLLRALPGAVSFL
jgi:hypothetical protein